jgi:enoyl-CoA hydratase/carnithine racemase
MSEEIDIDVRDGVQLIRWKRAHKRNALIGAMYERMSAALAVSEANDAIGVHVFIGSDGVFTAGNDINDFMRRAEDGSQDVAPSQLFVQQLPKVTKPMIAAVDGLAVGVGVTLLLHCDLVYATPTATFRAPFVDLGLIQEAGSSVLGPARLGHARAFELLVLGESWSAERGLTAGLINAIVAPGELEGRAFAAARRLAAKPRAAMLAARRMLKVDPALIAATIAKEAAEYRTLLRSPEAREAFAAFLEKRNPDFARVRRG